MFLWDLLWKLLVGAENSGEEEEGDGGAELDPNG
jgi:hypothetical protein